jgi:methylenetetrahydrofolate dehydrogenase (NADP+)/methenyltetrahydrofolate cyclohydrolase
MTKLLNGNALALKIRKEIASEVDKLKMVGFRAPHLVAVLVGNNVICKDYVDLKIKDCQSVGFHSSLECLPPSIAQEKLLSIIHILNSDNSIDGFIVQLPLPSHIETEKIILSIDPEKDLDGFHPLNIGKMVLGIDSFLPATPFGIITLLDKYSIPLKGKHTVILGRSSIVGKPLSLLMSRKHNPGNSTVTLTHSYTPEISYYTRKADIIISALGIPGFLKEDMISKGAVVIDVGIIRLEDASTTKGYNLVGDVDFKNVLGKASYLTPVPGGIGPLTRAMLLRNTLWALKKKIVF